MQNRYVGDVGDFAKYGLLRHLAVKDGLRLGVVWYLFDDETHNSDGHHITYLRDSNFAALDPALHQTLGRLVAAKKRSVRAIANAGILPKNTVFFDIPIVRTNRVIKPAPQRVRERASWLNKALAATEACDLVFFDPDNGLETASVARHSPKGGKYVFWDELSPFWDRGQSLVVYHHLNRTASVAKQTEVLHEKFAARFGADALVRYFLFRRGSCRHFWLVAQGRHARHCQSVIENINRSKWCEYFSIG